MDPRNRKLRLLKNTVRNLTPSAASRAVGGAKQIQPGDDSAGGWECGWTWWCSAGCTGTCTQDTACQTAAFTNCCGTATCNGTCATDCTCDGATCTMCGPCATTI
jgi:hypothetical protein